jgi:hypothetical protein
LNNYQQGYRICDGTGLSGGFTRRPESELTDQIRSVGITASACRRTIDQGLSGVPFLDQSSDLKTAWA